MLTLINRNDTFTAYIKSFPCSQSFNSLLLLATRPFMAFDTDSQNVKTESGMQVVQKRSNFFKTCLFNWGQEKTLDSKKKKKGHFALQNNCWKLYRDWKLNAFVDCLMICRRKQCFGEYGLKRHYPFLLVNLIVSVEWIKVGSE